MKIPLFLCLLFFQVTFALDLNFRCSSEHIEILCSEQDLAVCEDLLEVSEKMYNQLSLEFAHQIDYKIEVHLFPDIHSFHQAIQQEDAPDWLIITYEPVIRMTSPLHPGSYHAQENIGKALCRGIIHRFIYDKFPQCNAPRWLISGVEAIKANWPYVTLPASLPNIDDLEKDLNRTPGLGWCAWSIVSFIEKKYGWQAIHQILEDYSCFESALGLSPKELLLQWQVSIKDIIK